MGQVSIGLNVRVMTGNAIEPVLDELAALRIGIFREWPYLYDGDMTYERRYLEAYQGGRDSLIIGAYDGDWMVGASTGAPLSDHADDFADAFANSDLDLSRVFYCAESVLMTKYRGRGLGKQFFDMREAHARARGYDFICFCAVMRPEFHPLRPITYRALDGFWETRGYAPMPGIVASFSWKDCDQRHETRKPLQFWGRAL